MFCVWQPYLKNIPHLKNKLKPGVFFSLQQHTWLWVSVFSVSPGSDCWSLCWQVLARGEWNNRTSNLWVHARKRHWWKKNNKKKSGEAGVHMESPVAEEIPCNPFELTEKGTGLQILAARLRLHEVESSAKTKMLFIWAEFKNCYLVSYVKGSLRFSAAFCLSLPVLCSTFSSLLQLGRVYWFGFLFFPGVTV